MPLISVIVTTYNRPELLLETLTSIRDQSLQDIEIIVVDNYSNYDFPESIKRVQDQRIRFFQNQNNGIIAINRNFGASKATADYLAFCDDDDLWSPEKLSIQLQIMKRNSRVGLCFTRTQIIDENGNVQYSCAPVKKCYRGFSFKQLFCSGNTIALSSTLISRTIFNSLNGFSEQKEIITMEDYHLWLRLSRVTPIDFSNKCLTHYRVHSSSNSFQSTKYLNTGIALLRLIEADYPHMPLYWKLKKRILLGKEFLRKRYQEM